MIMYLRVMFVKLLIIYFSPACILSVYSKYSQSEIDNAYQKMAGKERFQTPLNNQYGCWPKNTIPFLIKPGFNDNQVQHIFKDIYQIQNKTCLRWVQVYETYGLKKYVEFQYSPDRRIYCKTQEQKIFYLKPKPHSVIRRLIVLPKRCFHQESVIHEMLHALGFIHEHQRIDRDCYVVVDEDRSKTDLSFKIIQNFNAFEKWPYDKRSIIHYTRLPSLLRDIDEPWPGWLWRYALGDQFSNGILTGMDVYKLNYRFCGAPDYCKIKHNECVRIEEEENKKGCKKIYEDIIEGIAKPSQQ